MRPTLAKFTLLTSLAGMAPTALQATTACPTPRAEAQAALANIFERQDEIDDLRAGGHGPLRIAYLHPDPDPYREILARLAVREEVELTRYRLESTPTGLARAARQLAQIQADWVLVSSDPVWHGAILSALSREGVASAQVIRFQHAARRRGEVPECPSGQRTRKPGAVGLNTFKVDPAIRQSEVAFIKRPDPDFSAVFALLDYLVEEANETHFGVRYYRHGARQLQFTVYHGDDGRTDYYGPHEDGAFASGNGLTQRKLSVMLQLSDPESYTGGGFVMHHLANRPPPETVASQGSLLVFPSILRHEVRKVTKGTRYSLVAWYLGEPWR